MCLCILFNMTSSLYLYSGLFNFIWNWSRYITIFYCTLYYILIFNKFTVLRLRRKYVVAVNCLNIFHRQKLSFKCRCIMWSHVLQTINDTGARANCWALSCFTLQHISHMIEWNKSIEKHRHHYCYWGERVSFFHLPDTFNRHCNLSLSCPRTSITNEFMKPFTEWAFLPLSPLCWGPGVITGTCWALALTLTMNGSPIKGQVWSVWLQYTFRLRCEEICECLYEQSGARYDLWLRLKHLLWSCCIKTNTFWNVNYLSSCLIQSFCLCNKYVKNKNI